MADRQKTKEERLNELVEKACCLATKDSRNFLEKMEKGEKTELLSLFKEVRGSCLLCGGTWCKCQY